MGKDGIEDCLMCTLMSSGWDVTEEQKKLLTFEFGCAIGLVAGKTLVSEKDFSFDDVTESLCQKHSMLFGAIEGMSAVAIRQAKKGKKK